jgi:hypothetical protein
VIIHDFDRLAGLRLDRLSLFFREFGNHLSIPQFRSPCRRRS